MECFDVLIGNGEFFEGRKNRITKKWKKEII